MKNDTLLSIDIESVNRDVKVRKLTRLVAVSVGCLGLLGALSLARLTSKESRFLMLMNSLVGGVTYCCVQGKSKSEKLKEFYDKEVTETYKNTLQNEAARHRTITDIMEQNKLAEIVSNPRLTPTYQIDFWAGKYGVAHLLPENNMGTQQTENEPSEHWSDNEPQYTISKAPDTTPTDDWIKTIVTEMTLPMNQRKHQHLKIDGGTQSGKSTLFSYILELLTRKEQVEICLIDPKYPMTQWTVPATYKGYEQVLAGMKHIIEILEDRKREALKATEQGLPMPIWSRFVGILDEWDSIYGNGKGAPGLITKKEMELIKGFITRVFKEAAAYNMTMVLIGQSPLSTDNGFSRSTFNSTSRIVVGTEALKWVNDPGFPWKNNAANLGEELETITSLNSSARFALIVPNVGVPYVRETPVINLKQHKPTSTSNPVELIRKLWAERGGLTDEQLKLCWKQLTNSNLTDAGVELLKSKLKGTEE